MSAYCNTQAPRVSCVLWLQTTNIGIVKPSVRANLICNAIWRHSSTHIPHLSLVRVCTRIAQRIGASKVFHKSEEHTA